MPGAHVRSEALISPSIQPASSMTMGGDGLGAMPTVDGQPRPMSPKTAVSIVSPSPERVLAIRDRMLH